MSNTDIISSGIYSEITNTILVETAPYPGIEKILKNVISVFQTNGEIKNNNERIYYQVKNNKIYYAIIDKKESLYVAEDAVNNMIEFQEKKNKHPSSIYGLYDLKAGKSIPILKVHVKVKIIDTIAKVKLIQEYSNLESQENEISYTFPMDELSAINSFKVILKDEEIIGKVFEKEEAKEKYDKAISKDKTAILLETNEDNPDIFKITLGNFPTDSSITTEISYVTEIIKNSDKEVRFYLPKVIANKYGMDPENTIDYTINFEAKITMDSEIDEIKSFGYGIKSDIDKKKAKVSFESKIKDKETFYLNIKCKKKSEIRNWVEIKNDETMSIMSIIPCHITDEIFEKTDKKELEIVFLVDVSGSMNNDNRINNAKDSLQFFLRSLPSKVKFNIIKFASLYSSLFDKSKKLKDETLKEAIEFIHNIKADGGTQIYEPLKFILEQKRDKEVKLQIIIVTDGEVSNHKKIMDLISNKENMRIFSLGIGSGASESLIRGLAKHGNGICEFVVDGERHEKKVMNLLKASLMGKIENVSFKWENYKSLIIPEFLKLDYSKETNIFSFFSLEDTKKIKDEKKITALLTYDYQNEKYEKKIEIDLENEEILNSKTIHSLAAKNAIKTLKDRDLVVKISVENNVLSNHTSFLAVSKKRKYSQRGENILSKDDLEQINKSNILIF